MSEDDHITAEPPLRGQRWTFRRGDVSDRADPDDAAQLRRAARVLSCEVDELRAAARVVTSPPPPDAGRIELRVTGPGGAVVTQEEPLLPSEVVPRLARARRVEWDGLETMACVHLELLPGEDGTPLVQASGADAGWVARGRASLLFLAEEGIPAGERAAASALAVDMLGLSPRVSRSEVRSDFAPPGQGDAWAGHAPLAARVWRATTACAEIVEQDDPRVSEWLSRTGLDAPRDRHPHDLCPIRPGHVSGRDPIIVLDRGVWCHSCAGRHDDGWRSWGQLVAGSAAISVAHPWVDAAREFVHWEHARRSLPDLGAGDHAARLAYSGLLRACHGRLRREDPAGLDALVTQSFNPGLLWVRGDAGTWLHAEALSPIELRDPELACLPWVRGRRELVALARSSAPLAGYIPVRPVDVVLNPDSVPADVAPVRRRPIPGEPPAPLCGEVEPLDLETAWSVLEGDFPGVRRDYVRALLLACACSEAGGPPAVLVAFGSSGAAKTQTVSLVSSMLGGRWADLSDSISKEEDFWRRRCGEAIASGLRPLVVNDLHRVRGLHQQIKLVISMEDPLEFRPLFSSATRTRLRAPLVLTCVTLPRALAAPEIARRIRVFRLPERVPEWRFLPVKPARWRSTPTEEEQLASTDPREWTRTRAAEAILLAARSDAAACGFEWFRCAELVGAVAGEEADPEQDEADRDLLRRLFQHCCGLNGTRAMSSSAKWQGARGWVDLTSPAAQKILEEMLPDLGPGNDPRHILNQQLMEIDWQRALPSACPVRFVGNVKHATWVGRFEGQGLRGQVPINEGLVQ